MHESGLIRSLLRTALAEAERRDAELAAINVRLGVLAGGSPEHLREHFEVELLQLGLGPIRLNIESDPEYPSGIEIIGVELRQRTT